MEPTLIKKNNYFLTPTYWPLEVMLRRSYCILMKNTIFTFIFFITIPLYAQVPAKLNKSVEFIFWKVLEKKHLDIRPEVKFPSIYFSSKTQLKQFQDAIEKQWGQRPKEITNAFAIENNEIYLLDDSNYYKRLNRCIDDSLAHEIVHYIQTKYLGWDISQDESLEWEAIEIQTELRAELCKI